MLIPRPQNITGYIGGTFQVPIQLFKNKELTEIYSFSGYTAKLSIEGIKILEEGKGLVAKPTEGIIEITMTHTETEELMSQLTATSLTPVRYENIHYYASLKSGEEIVFPVHGHITFELP
jgi:hypothetical protein